MPLNTIKKKQIFRGFSSLDGNRDVLYDIDLIKADLINAFYTKKRERVMYPEEGSIIWSKLFDQLTDSVVDEIIDDCKRIVGNDPRLHLENVLVEEFEYGLNIRMDLFYTPFDLSEPLELTFDRRLAESI